MDEKVKFKISRVTDGIGEKYNGIWLFQKPCKCAIAEGDVYNISELDMYLDKHCDTKGIDISGLSLVKEEYSEGWYICINTALDIQKLTSEVGSIIIDPDNDIKIYDGYVE